MATVAAQAHIARRRRVAAAVVLAVAALILYLYVSAAARLLASLRETQAAQRSLASLRAEYRQLAAQRQQLQSPSYIETQARRLGLAFPGERQYLIGSPEG